MRDKVELLSPAGNREGFLAAVCAGADAVYLAGTRFGARAYADNFSNEELIRTIHYAHVLGVRVYLTVNILTKQDEMESTVDFVCRMYEEGLDGVIVQDLGLIRRLHGRCPQLLLHASTQMSITGPEAVSYLKRLGVSRIVPARELSLSEIRTIKSEAPIEIEAFVHGAMCYSYSGRCLMSSFLGGRSGNRGRCAGPCRLPYEVLDEEHRPVGPDAGRSECYPISMRDMSTLSILPDLIDAGIDSFKIEGRMKKPEYAAGVTAMYRKYIDRFYEWDRQGRPGKWSVDRNDRKELSSLYIRSEISEGYYKRRNGRSLVTIDKPGYAGSDEKLLHTIREKYLEHPPKRQIDGKALLHVGEPVRLTVCTVGADGISVTVTGEEPDRAQKRPLHKEEIEKRLRKTGDSPFTFGRLLVDADDNIFVPVGKINALRRDALSQLEWKLSGAGRAAVRASADEKPSETVAPDKAGHELWAQVVNDEQFRAAVRAGADAVILDGAADFPDVHRDSPVRRILALPDIYRIPDREFVFSQIDRAESENMYGILVRSLEELVLVKRSGFGGKIIADSWLYAWNRESSDLLLRDCSALILPLELTAAELYDTFGRRSGDREIVTVYGRLPMMLTAGCLHKTEKLCRHEDGTFWYLKDRKGAEFPVRNICTSCHNVIYNSVPLSLHRFYGDKVIQKARVRLCSFTTESGDETEKILAFFRSENFDGAAGPVSYTAGHFRNRSGVL